MTFWLRSGHGVAKSRICSSFFSYDLLTTNTSLLVDVEVGRNFRNNNYRFEAIFIQFLNATEKYGFSYCHLLNVLNKFTLILALHRFTCACRGKTL